jgi:hypothetical protein
MYRRIFSLFVAAKFNNNLQDIPGGISNVYRPWIGFRRSSIRKDAEYYALNAIFLNNVRL